jgi:hypothetical protein
MRQGSNGRRPRGRPHRKQHGSAPRHNNFESSGPDGRIRGNAHQVYEKYVGLALDALSSGDRVAAENYYQYAEHYYRVLNARTDPQPNGEGQPGRQGGNGQTEAADLHGRSGTTGRPSPVASPVAPPVAGAGEQPREAARADAQPAVQPRRRPKPEPAVESEAEEKPGEDGETTEA